MQLTLIIQPLDEGGYFGQIQELPAVLTEGETVEEVKENIIDALDLHLSYLRENSDVSFEYRQSQPIIRESLTFA